MKTASCTSCNSALLLPFILCTFNSAYASVILDGTLGKSGSISGPNYAITADLGKQAGSNLFHSFAQFNLVKGDIATFSGPSSVSNIISRVTGGTASSIDGALKSTINGANLYFINPAGVMFGPNAKLDVSGSFHVTTADYLTLGTDGRFDAGTPANSLLTVSPPSAFGFVSAKPVGINVDGSYLKTVEGKSVTVTGGDITLANANIYAPSGTVGIVPVASEGQVTLANGSISETHFSKLGVLTVSETRNTAGTLTYPFNANYSIGNIDVSGSSRSGAISIQSGAIYLSNAQLSSRLFGNQQGGAIQINAERDLSLTNNSIIRNNSIGTGNAGNTSINASRIIVDNSVIMSSPFAAGKGGALHMYASDMIHLVNGGYIEIAAEDGTGDSGSAAISTANMVIDGTLSGISASTWTSGKGGILDITATESLSLVNGGSINVTALRGSTGDAGTAIIKTARLTNSGGYISGATRSTGKGGVLDIKAYDSIDVTNAGYIYVDTTGSGNGGLLTIDTATLNIDNLSSVSSETWSSGKGGNLTIKASKSIHLKTEGNITVNAEGSGNAGTLTIETATLSLDGGYINGSTWASGNGGNLIIKATDSIRLTNAGSIYTDTHAAGEAGSLVLGTAVLSIDGYSYIGGTTWLSGKGGLLDIKASEAISLTNFGEISVKTNGTGDAGSVRIETPLLHIENSGISGITFSSGKGGGVSIGATNAVTLKDQGYIVVNALSGTGAAGSVDITSRLLTIEDDSYISATTRTPGKGGNLTINASDSINLSNGGHISSSSSGAGNAGSVTVATGALNMAANASISSGSTGSGKAGELNLKASDQIRLTDSSITTSTTKSDGGNITISDTTLIDLRNSQVSTSVKGGTGSGGNISVTAKQLVLDTGSIIANAEGGNGGNITLNTQALIPSTTGSIISASSKLGISGTISVSSPLVDIGAGLAVMPNTIVDLNALSPKRCASSSDEISSFSVMECSGVITNPDRPVITP